MTEPRDFDQERRRILRRLTLLTWGLWAAAVLMAVAGGALMAWMLSTRGVPFRTAWIIGTVLLLAIPAAVHLINRKRTD